MPAPTPAPKDRPLQETLTPHFVHLTRNVLFGDVWEQPGLSKRDRSMITVAALTVLYRTDQLRGHIRRALDNGVKREELGEMFQHLAFYGGWPTAVNAFNLAKEVFAEVDAKK